MNKSFRARHKNKNIMIYASSDGDADMFYATNFRCTDPFIFVRTARGKRHLVMSDLEIDRAKSQSNAHHVHSLSEYQRRASQAFGARYEIEQLLSVVLGDLGIRNITVPQSFPVGVADGLREGGVGVRALRDPFFPERIYKSPAEIAEIRKALRATEKAIKAAIDTLRNSKIKGRCLMHDGKKLTAETLRTIINTTLLAAGYLPSGTIVAPGKKGCDPHDQGSGIIRPNEPVIIDVFPRSEKSGYFGDITRTVVRGEASHTVKQMFRAVLAGQRLGLRSVRHGAKTRHVHSAINHLFEKRGFSTGEKNGRMQGFFHGTGHGLGLEIHEPPRIGMNNIELERGMVVTVEPGLYYYPHGGVRIEDTVLVTRTGIKNLTRFPKFLEI